MSSIFTFSNKDTIDNIPIRKTYHASIDPSILHIEEEAEQQS